MVHTSAHQLNFFDTGWPQHDRFPHNNSQDNVKDRVFDDLLVSKHPLIVTGYTSLEMIIEFLARTTKATTPIQEIRLVLGNEPFPSNGKKFQLPNHRFEDDIAGYWLHQGISLILSAKVLIAIELLKKRVVRARISEDSRPLHAKIYCGSDAVTLGSSNFSHSGLVWQTEANARFTLQEKARFDKTWQIAERIWGIGKDYIDDLVKLLEKLLHTVTWQEALARVCAEVLEGNWAKRYMQNRTFSDSVPLWPSQKQGIAQAMWVIEHIGSVLIADATGSGKTQMGGLCCKTMKKARWAWRGSPRSVMLLLQTAWRPLQLGLSHLLCSPLALVLS